MSDNEGLGQAIIPNWLFYGIVLGAWLPSLLGMIAIWSLIGMVLASVGLYLVDRYLRSRTHV